MIIIKEEEIIKMEGKGDNFTKSCKLSDLILQVIQKEIDEIKDMLIY